MKRLLKVSKVVRWASLIGLVACGGLSQSAFADDAGAAKKKTRERNLSGEGQLHKVGDQTKVDFEAADISGARKTPMGSLINQNKADKDYDFVKLRMSWHPEMIKSAASLDNKGE